MGYKSTCILLLLIATVTAYTDITMTNCPAQFEINTVQRITEGARGILIGQRLIVIREKRQASPGSKLQTHCYYNPVLLAENPPCSLKLKVTSLTPTTDWTWRGFERFCSEHSLNRTYAAAQASQ